MATTPIVLTLAGHDPCGGAGIQADIETILAHRVRSASVITCLTEQDTHEVYKIIPQDADDFYSQANRVLQDLPIRAIKLGLLGNQKIAAKLIDLLHQYPKIPVVLDPVLAAGGGGDLASPLLVDEIKHQLLALTTLITPNSIEARRLTGEEDLAQSAQALLAMGCQHVLISGGHEPDEAVINRLYSANGKTHQWSWPRLVHQYHGSGCTLAAACAALMAKGTTDLTVVLEQAQHFTWQSLKNGEAVGRGQHLPTRT